MTFPNELEFVVGFNGRPVIVVCECDGYKPLDITVYDQESGDELTLLPADHRQLYQIACEKAANRMFGDRL